MHIQPFACQSYTTHIIVVVDVAVAESIGVYSNVLHHRCDVNWIELYELTHKFKLQTSHAHTSLFACLSVVVARTYGLSRGNGQKCEFVREENHLTMKSRRKVLHSLCRHAQVYELQSRFDIPQLVVNSWVLIRVWVPKSNLMNKW